MSDIYSKEVMTACGLLLFSVADADEKLEPKELGTIRDILTDFFHISDEEAVGLMDISRKELHISTGLFETGAILNNSWDYDEKIEFIRSIFEVGFSDGSLHYLEHHIISNIAHILHVEHDDLIAAKIEVKDWFKKD